jgi:hypothetical protein
MDGGLGRQNEVASADVEQATRDEILQGALEAITLLPLGGGDGQFAHQLVLGADFGIDVEDLAKEAPLVADVLVVSESGGTNVRANRLVVQCQPSASSGGGVRPERLVPQMAVG